MPRETVERLFKLARKSENVSFAVSLVAFLKNNRQFSLHPDHVRFFVSKSEDFAYKLLVRNKQRSFLMNLQTVFNLSWLSVQTNNHGSCSKNSKF
jgi:hypothetical protein